MKKAAWWTILIALYGALGAMSDLRAQQAVASEYDVKAAYLVNFARFTTWPTERGVGAPFRICVLGRDPFEAVLDATVVDERIDGEIITVVRIDAPEDAAGCRVLFVSASEAPHLEAILGGVVGEPVLTVSDLPGFSDRGGIIEFVPEGRRVRFSVNLASATEAGLTLSAELLRVAKSVVSNPRPRA